jgi:preprotein translocase subunit SecE
MAKIIQFFIEVKSELSKVVWPSRRDTIKYTIVVVIFSLAISALLASTDLGLAKVLQRIINR